MEVRIEDIEGLIYCIKNKLNNKVYIGQTLSHFYDKNGFWIPGGINFRFSSHCRCDSMLIGKAIKEDGVSNFEITELYRLPSKDIEKLDFKEAEYIEQFDSITPKGYNVKGYSPSLGKGKRVILEYYKKQSLQSLDHLKRINRSRQKTLGVHKRKVQEEILRKSAITEINVIGIKHDGQLKEVRLLFSLFGQKNRKRLVFTGKRPIKEIIEDAINCAHRICPHDEFIVVQPCIRDILNGGNGEVYKYQKKLDEVSSYKSVNKITGKAYFHKGLNCYTYIIFFRGEGNERLNFGGKRQTIEKTFEEVQEFIKKLPYYDQITVELTEPPCPELENGSD